MVLDKTALRALARKTRDALSADAREKASSALVQASPFAVQGQTVSAYFAIGSEIDPAPLLQAIAAGGAQVALPVLLDQETMVFRRFEPAAPLVPVGFGTMGPDADQPAVQPDLILAPLLAFTSSGQRIGYGKGHYDRALAKLLEHGKRPALVGLAFDEQEVASFPREAHDIPLDGVLTPQRLRLFQGGREALAPFLP